MPNLAAISQTITEINRGVESTPQALSVSNRPGEIGLSSRDHVFDSKYIL